MSRAAQQDQQHSEVILSRASEPALSPASLLDQKGLFCSTSAEGKVKHSRLPLFTSSERKGAPSPYWAFPTRRPQAVSFLHDPLTLHMAGAAISFVQGGN